MKRIKYIFIIVSILSVCGCDSGKSIKEFAGLWVMDSGVYELIDIAGFEIAAKDNDYVIYLGTMSEGKLVQQEGPVVIRKKGSEFVAKISNETTLILIPDDTGLQLIGYSGAKKGSPYHFKRIATN